MPHKTFEQIISFHNVQTNTGATIWLPLITVNIVEPSGNRISLPLLFDTGASTTTLRHDLYPLLGLSSWDSGIPQSTLTAGGANPVPAYRYQATLEILGKAIQCPVHLQILPQNPLYLGLLGREQIFEEFGFGFWEKTHELYLTLNP